MIRKAYAVWNGDLREGSGRIGSESGAFDLKYSFRTRFEDAPGTNPEELIGAAHAACFSMALSAELTKDGFSPKRIETTAEVTIEKTGEGFSITRIRLATFAEVPGISDRDFVRIAEDSKVNCPVSKALAAVSIALEAKLI